MKKIFKGLCLLLAMIFVVACTACSGFFGEESIIISSVKTKTLEDGSTELTISYENEEAQESSQTGQNHYSLVSKESQGPLFPPHRLWIIF